MLENGQDILNGVADYFEETADYLMDEASDWADEATEYSDSIFDSVDFDPTPEIEPPQVVEDGMNKVPNTEYVETVDLARVCIYGTPLTISGAVSITMTGVGAGAGTLVVLGAGALTTISACAMHTFGQTVANNAGECDYRYVYVYEETDGFGNTENWHLIYQRCMN